MKKSLSFCLLFVVLFLSFSAYADQSGILENGIKWVLDSNGVLTITGEGEWTTTPDVPKYKITKVVIGNGITNVPVFAFSDCTLLSEVSLPSSVKSIGNHAFYGCTKLEKINIPNEIKAIEDGTFSDCVCLNNLALPQGITKIGTCAFWDCDSLLSIRIPSSVKNIGEYAFFWCDGLTSIEVPEGVTVIGKNAFGSCDNLSLVMLPSSLEFIGENALMDPTGINSATVICKKNTYSYRWAEKNDFSLFLLNAEDGITLPSYTTYIQAYSFQGINASTVTITANTVSIDEYAFSNLKNNVVIYMSDNIGTINNNAFYGSNIIMVCSYGKPSYNWAVSHNIRCIIR